MRKLECASAVTAGISLLGLLVLLGCLVASPALAKETAAVEAANAVEAAEEAEASEEGASEEEGSAVEVSIRVDAPTQYIWRGFVIEKDGLILQPSIDVTFGLWEREHGLQSLDLYLGTWGSFHEGPTGSGGAPGHPRSWFEQDLYVGLYAGFADRWSLGGLLSIYSSPNDSFETLTDFSAELSFDDSECWRSCALRSMGGLQPHATVTWEVEGQNDWGFSRGTFLELGLAPALTVANWCDAPITLTSAVNLGLSLSKYYENESGTDETFGFLELGLDLEVPLPFVPARLGAWALSGGAHAFIVGDNLAEINEGDHLEIVAQLGLGVSF